MSLTGLLQALLYDGGDPALRSAAADARHGAVTTLDLTAPPALRPFVVGTALDLDEALGQRKGLGRSEPLYGRLLRLQAAA